MIKSEVIIIGGGPAGSACARRLRQAGIETLLLDKKIFPRTKLCAGWITPRVLADLDLRPSEYSGSIIAYNRIIFHFRGIPLPVPTRQFAIRRSEFDNYLLKRASVPIDHHTVNAVRRENDSFIIDDRYRCRYLVGAGGTNCPVYRTFFRPFNPRPADLRIDTAEAEFPYVCRDRSCYLWFFNDGLPGYAWYVPKENGYLNIGIGGKADSLKKQGITIRAHWDRFTNMLARKGLVLNSPEPRGHIYYLRSKLDRLRSGNAFITGDAAGMATLDMGEGIGPAIQSGLAAAQAIITGRPYNLDHIARFSVPGILLAGFRRKKLSQLPGRKHPP